ncbi:MAG: SusC/RagA family TonB-linked outer membrane protein [Tannerellaceae bacterium]|jgi:TonB-linked SusC/RagA family outer membrane protein|nr:SusC/RagA family TonB-linked outer membrane protein [Tannerellaceae bacterium]
MLFACTVSVTAQVMPDDKTLQKIDLGFGVEQSELLTTAAATVISGEELQQTSAISLADALYGRLLGLTALQSGGFVGDEGLGASLNIRGFQSFSDINILVLVDGYERPIDRLTVEEVESVTVLKDAAAVAMLGHEGVNGAILVKTKRGATGKTHVKVGYSHKITFDPEFAEMLGGYDYAVALNKARTNDRLPIVYTNPELELIKSGSDPYFYPDVDWKKLAFKNAGSENNANLSVFGGAAKVQYYTLLDYTDSKGLLNVPKQQDYDPQLKYSKANIRSNVDFELSSTTKMSVNILGVFLETSHPSDVDATGASWYVYKTPASAFPYQTSTGIWGGNEAYGDGNVVAKIQESGYAKTHQRQLWANARLTQDLSFWLKGLSFAVGGGYDNASNTYEQRIKGHQYGYEYYTGAIGDKSHVAEIIMGNKQENLEFSHWVQTQWRIMQSYLGFYYNTSFMPGDNFSASAVYNAKNEVRDEQNHTYYRANWIGAFHYDYQQKYIADLVLAANGSNRSYPAKWAFSPTLSLGYIYANSPDKVLTYGKLRASAGIQHTDYVPQSGIWRGNWSDSHGEFIYSPGFSRAWGSFISAFPTTDFSQEKATKVDLGTDIRLWNALDITLDGYYQQRSHILVNAREKDSWVVGIPSAYDDVGGVKSYGVEAGMRFAKKITGDLYLNASGMLTWGKNEVTSYIENPAYKNLSVIGSGVSEAWGLESIGFFKDQADIDNSPRQEFSQVSPGDIKYKDQNGDGVINEFDRLALGSNMLFPDLNFAFSLGLEYKGFGANAWFQGTGDYMKNLMSVDGVWGVISNNRNLSRDYYNNSWDVAGESALYPRFTSQSVPNNEQAGTTWLKKVHFLKMRNCEVYYKLSQKVLNSLQLAGAKVFVQGQNLLSFDNVDAMDAEVLSTDYPVLKSVNFGLQITF